MGSVLQAELASEIAQWQYLVALYRLSKEAHSPSSKSRINKHTRALSLSKKESSNNSLLIILMILMMMIASRARGSRQTISGRMMEARRKRIALQLHSQIHISSSLLRNFDRKLSLSQKWALHKLQILIQSIVHSYHNEVLQLFPIFQRVIAEVG